MARRASRGQARAGRSPSPSPARATQRRKPARLWLLGTTALLPVAAGPVLAQPAPTTGPTGGQVVAGQAGIARTPGRTTITQGTDRAAIDWQQFNVGSQHTVQFVQPSQGSWTLNRVVGPDPSVIAGRVQANGGVAIVNQSGVVFAQGAQVDVGSLIASAAGITNENFMAGRMAFDQAPRRGARVENHGTITVADRGLAALVGPGVSNSGVIRARLGRVALGAAETFVLDLAGDGLIGIDVTQAVREAPQGGAALVTNSGTIEAPGGSVLLTAHAASDLVEDLVRQTGRISAPTADGRAGQVVLRAEGGSVRAEGTIEATGGAGARGGTVAIQASERVTVAAGATVDASGGTGGGRVLVGTEGRGRAQRMARQTTVEAGATIRADATAAGNGGEIVVNSAERTEMRGTLTARGGAASGNGGFIEVSGQGAFVLHGIVDLTAPNGALGDFLLDPQNIIISSNATPTLPFGTITETATGDSGLNPATVPSGSVFAAGNVRATGGGENDWVRVGAAAVENYTGGNIILEANRQIIVDSEITRGTAGSLTLRAGLGTGVTDGNIVQRSGANISVNGTLTLETNQGSISLGADVRATSVVLSASGNITQTGGDIQHRSDAATQLPLRAMSSAGNVTLAQTGNGNFALGASGATAGTFTVSADTLRVGSSLTANATTLTAADGTLTLAGDIRATSLALAGSAGVTQTAGTIAHRAHTTATPTALPLTATTTTSGNVGIDLAGNGPLSLGASTSAGTFTLRGAAIATTGTLTADAATLTAETGAIDLGADVRVNALTLQAETGIAQSGGTIERRTTPTSLVDLTANVGGTGDVVLERANGGLRLLTGGTTDGNFRVAAAATSGVASGSTVTVAGQASITVTGTGSGINLNGTLEANGASLQAQGAIDINGTLRADSVTLQAQGDINQATAAILAARSTTPGAAVDLTVTTGGAGNTAILDGTNGAIRLLAGTTEGEAFTLQGAGLTIAGPLNTSGTGGARGDVTLVSTGTAGAIALGGTVTARDATLRANGAITQTAALDLGGTGGGTLTIRGQTGAANTSAGSATLTGANQVATLDARTTGALAVTSAATTLTVEQARGNGVAITGQGVSLSVAGNATVVTGTGTGAVSVVANSLTVADGITQASGGTISLRADTITMGGAISAASGTVEIGPRTATRGVVVGGAADATRLQIAAADLNAVTAGTVRLGRTTIGGTAVTGGAVEIAAAVSLPATTTFEVAAGGNVTLGAAVEAGRVRLGATGDIALGTFDVTADGTSGGIELRAGGAITQGAGSELIAIGGTRDLVAQAGTGNLALTGTGSFRVADGGTNPRGLDAPGDVSVNLGTSGALTLAGALRSGGTASLTARSIDIQAALDAPTAVNLSASGNGTASTITQNAAGTITTALLTANATGAVSLAAAPNQVASLGAFSFNDAFGFRTNAAVTVSGTIAPTTVGSSADITLIASSLNVNAPIAAGTGTVTLQATGGNVTQTGAGTITAGLLEASASGSVLLEAAPNAVGRFGAGGAGGTFALRTGPSLTIEEALAQGTGGGILRLTTDGSLTVANGGSIAFSDVTLAAGTGMTISGNIGQAGATVRLGTAGAITQTATGGITAGTLGIFASGNIALTAGTNSVGAIAALTSGTFAYRGGGAVETTTVANVPLPLFGGFIPASISGIRATSVDITADSLRVRAATGPTGPVEGLAATAADGLVRLRLDGLAIEADSAITAGTGPTFGGSIDLATRTAGRNIVIGANDDNALALAQACSAASSARPSRSARRAPARDTHGWRRRQQQRGRRTRAARRLHRHRGRAVHVRHGARQPHRRDGRHHAIRRGLHLRAEPRRDRDARRRAARRRGGGEQHHARDIRRHPRPGHGHGFRQRRRRRLRLPQRWQCQHRRAGHHRRRRHRHAGLDDGEHRPGGRRADHDRHPRRERARGRHAGPRHERGRHARRRLGRQCRLYLPQRRHPDGRGRLLLRRRHHARIHRDDDAHGRRLRADRARAAAHRPGLRHARRGRDQPDRRRHHRERARRLGGRDHLTDRREPGGDPGGRDRCRERRERPVGRGGHRLHAEQRTRRHSVLLRRHPARPDRHCADLRGVGRHHRAAHERARHQLRRHGLPRPRRYGALRALRQRARDRHRRHCGRRDKPRHRHPAAGLGRAARDRRHDRRGRTDGRHPLHRRRGARRRQHAGTAERRRDLRQRRRPVGQPRQRLRQWRHQPRQCRQRHRRRRGRHQPTRGRGDGRFRHHRHGGDARGRCRDPGRRGPHHRTAGGGFRDRRRCAHRRRHARRIEITGTQTVSLGGAGANPGTARLEAAELARLDAAGGTIRIAGPAIGIDGAWTLAPADAARLELLLTAGGTGFIVQSGGPLSVDTLAIDARQGIGLVSVGNSGNDIRLLDVQSTGPLTVTAGSDLTVQRAHATSGNIAVTGGSITLADTAGGAVRATAGNVALTATAGDVTGTGPGAAVSGNALTATALGGEVRLAGDNTVGTFTGTARDGVLFRNTGALTAAATGGAGTAVAGDVDIRATALTLNDIRATGTVTLDASAGDIAQAPGATLTAGTLAATATGSIRLDGANLATGAANNAIQDLTALSAGAAGDITLRNGTDLTVDLPLSVGANRTLTLEAAGLTIAGNLSAGGPAGQIILRTGGFTAAAGTGTGNITQQSGTISAPRVAALAAGNVTLDQAGNDIGALAGGRNVAGGALGLGLSAGGDATVRIRAGATLGVEEALQVGTGRTLTLRADDLAIGAQLRAPAGTIVLLPATANGTIGYVLGGAAGSVSGGNITLDSAELAFLPAGTPAAVLSLGDATTTGAVTISGIVDLVDGASPRVGRLELAGNAGLTQDPGSVLDVAALRATFPNGSVLLDPGSAANRIAALDGVTAGGDVVVRGGAGPMALRDGGAGDAVVAGTGRRVVLRADDLDIQAAVRAPGGTVYLLPETNGRAVTLGGTGAGTMALDAAEIARLGFDGAVTARLVIGSDGTLRSAGDIRILGDVALRGPGGDRVGQLDLAAGGSVIQSLGVIDVATLTGTAQGDFIANGTNRIDAFAGITSGRLVGGGTAPADIALRSVLDLRLAGIDATRNLGVSGSGALTATPVTIATDAGPATIAAALTAGGTLSMTSPGGAISAGPLTASSIVLDGASIALTGRIGGAGANAALVDLAATGTISQDAGAVIAADRLRVSAGSVTLNEANRVAEILSFTAGGPVAFTSVLPLLVSGTVSANGSLALTSSGTLTVGTGGALSVTGGAGTLDLTSGGTMSVSGSLSASGNATLDATAGGIAYGATGTVGGTARLTAPGAITLAGSLVATGGIEATAGLALASSGVLRSGGALALQGGTTLSQTGAAQAGLGVSLVSGRAMTVGGTLRAGTDVAMTAGGLATLSSGKITAPGIVSLLAGGGIAMQSFTIDPTTIGLQTGGALSASDSTLVASGTIRLAGGSVSLRNLSAVAGTLDIESTGTLRLDGGAFTLGRAVLFSAPGGISAGGVVTVAPRDAGALPVVMYDTRAAGASPDPLSVVRPDIPGLPAAQQPMQVRLPGTEVPGVFGPASSAAAGPLAINIDAGRSPLFLLIDGGFATGTIVSAGRLGIHGTGGGAELTGRLADISGNLIGGSAAARFADSTRPAASGALTRYRLNSCVISSVNCIVPSQVISIPQAPPQRVDIALGGGRITDPDVQIPNVAEEDY